MLRTVVGLLIVLLGCGILLPARTAAQAPTDIARVRQLLDERGSPTLTLTRSVTAATFRVDVFAPRLPYIPDKPYLPNLDEALTAALRVQPPLAVPGAETVGRTLASIEVFSLIRRARAAWYRQKVAREAKEVAAELAAVEARWDVRRDSVEPRKHR